MNCESKIYVNVQMVNSVYVISVHQKSSSGLFLLFFLANLVVILGWITLAGFKSPLKLNMYVD